MNVCVAIPTQVKETLRAAIQSGAPLSPAYGMAPALERELIREMRAERWQSTAARVCDRGVWPVGGMTHTR
jgi:hypothetical protein